MTMGLFQSLCDTYDAMMPSMDFRDPRHVPMAPVAHTVKWADICITVDAAGRFVTARSRVRPKPGKNGDVSDFDTRVVMPVTEKSLGRGAGSDKYPHYLCDFLRYMMPENKIAYGSYMSQLSAWTRSNHSHAKAEAVLEYVSGGTILQDLSTCGVIELDETGMLKSDKLMICWDVVGLGVDSGPCHEDAVLMEQLTAYHLDVVQRDNRCGVCMVTGSTGPLADQHAKGVVPWFGNAKIISSNSTKNNEFTYRGRFTCGDEVVSVGYEASQKAHNALAWLVANQGVSYGNRVFLSWNPDGIVIPSVSGPLGFPDDDDDMPVQASDYKDQLKKAVSAWHAEIPDGTGVVFAMLDAATPGCLSIAHHNEMPGIEYIDRFAAWASVCREGNYVPSLYQLVRYAYGTARNGSYEISDAAASRHMLRLVLCRLDGSIFPRDVYINLVRNASRLIACDGCGEKGAPSRIQLLLAACAAVRKYRFDVYKEEFDMSLDRSLADRSYLYGRLLAVAEHVERRSYSRDEKREPAAMRLQQVFTQQPASTWRQLHGRLSPYFARLRPGTREYLRREIGEIMDMFPVDSQTNSALGDLYLLGYYHERVWLRSGSVAVGGSAEYDMGNHDDEEETDDE